MSEEEEGKRESQKAYDHIMVIYIRNTNFICQKKEISKREQVKIQNVIKTCLYERESMINEYNTSTVVVRVTKKRDEVRSPDEILCWHRFVRCQRDSMMMR